MRYELYTWWNEDPGWQPLGGDDLTGATYTHSGVTAGVTYYYTIRAVNAAGEWSAWQQYASATALAVSGTPTATATPAPTSEPTPAPGSPESDRAVLVALYNATDGPNWTNNTNWLSDKPLREWHGVNTDANGRVTHLDLIRNNLNGPIPSELGNLSHLTELYFWNNGLSGTIPPELGSLSKLTRLGLAVNKLSGTIPPELGNLNNLTWLRLFQNQLSGEIPSELADLTNLRTLRLSQNQLSGEIPSELGNLANLSWLALNNNQLSGSIPLELGNLANLDYLALSNNRFSVTIPAWLGSLPKLTKLSLGGNQWSGTVPAWLGNLTNLELLDLSDIQWSGTIPAWLGNLINLETLWLSDNQLSGTIPSELGNLANLKWLILAGNSLSGPIPSELGNLTKLERLYLNDNQLGGTISTELGNLKNLEHLWLVNNQFKGCIPTSLARVKFNDLTRLGLPFCPDTSGVPTTIKLTATPNAGMITLQWEPVSHAVRYELWTRWYAVKLRRFDEGGLTGASYTHEDPLPGVSYDYQIHALNAAGRIIAVSEWVSATVTLPTQLPPPPSSLGLDPFYKKYVDAGGIALVSHSDVSDEALWQARDTIAGMLSDRPDLLATMAANRFRVALYNPDAGRRADAGASILPEVGGRGAAGFAASTYAGAPEPENSGECAVTLIHEFAHLVHHAILDYQPGGRTFDSRLRTTYQTAINAGLWRGRYAATNPSEYWADTVMYWFLPSWFILHRLTPANVSILADYDPEIAKLIEEVFGTATIPDCILP